MRNSILTSCFLLGEKDTSKEIIETAYSQALVTLADLEQIRSLWWTDLDVQSIVRHVTDDVIVDEDEGDKPMFNPAKLHRSTGPYSAQKTRETRQVGSVSKPRQAPAHHRQVLSAQKLREIPKNTFVAPSSHSQRVQPMKHTSPTISSASEVRNRENPTHVIDINIFSRLLREKAPPSKHHLPMLDFCRPKILLK